MLASVCTCMLPFFNTGLWSKIQKKIFDANEKVSYAQSKKDWRLKRVLSLLPPPCNDYMVQCGAYFSVKFRTEPNAKVTLVAKYVDMLIDVVNFPHFQLHLQNQLANFNRFGTKHLRARFFYMFFQGRVKTPKWGDNILRNSSEKRCVLKTIFSRNK